MKLFHVLAALCFLFSSMAYPQTVQPALFQPKANSVVATPAAASCEVSICQQNCYVQNSHCDRNDNSGCGTKMQSCLQACTSQCR